MRQLIALAMLLAWLPASSHDLMEAAGLIHNHDVVGSDSGHDAADGVCISPSVLKVSQPHFCAIVLPAVSELLFQLDSQAADELPQSGTSPPGLKTWPLFLRATSSPRAPSFIS